MIMKLAILGATGGIGGHLLTWALQSGHDVQALARTPAGLSGAGGPAPGGPAPEVPGAGGSGAGVPAAGRLTVTGGDALDAGAVADVIAGTDAVLSALGPRGAKTPGLLGGAAVNIADGMAKAGVRRLICVSAAGAFITGDPDSGILIKAILPRLFATPFADTRQMEAVIRASDLDWTLVRATRLVNGPLTRRYRVSPDYPPPRGRKISRADVAHFIERALADDDWLRAAPALGY
jgi:putative NADH-flavin reductase